VIEVVRIDRNEPTFRPHLAVDETRIAVSTDEGWVEGVVEYAQIVKGAHGKRHTAYHVKVEFPEGPMHVTIGLDGSPPLSEMEWWIVGQEGRHSDEESHNGSSMRDDSSMALDLESSLRSHEGSMKEAAPLSSEHDSKNSCENHPPFDSRTGSPLPSISNESSKESILTHQHGS